MTTESDPIIGNWYYHLDKGQRFQVVAMDEETQTVEVQYFDGNVDEHELGNLAKNDKRWRDNRQ